jgi:hypothetical protein
MRSQLQVLTSVLTDGFTNSIPVDYINCWFQEVKLSLSWIFVMQYLVFIFAFNINSMELNDASDITYFVDKDNLSQYRFHRGTYIPDDK